MKVIRFHDVETFYARVEPYLLPREAEHNLTLGLLGTIRHEPSRFPDAVFTLVEDGGAIQVVAMQTNPERGLILSLAESLDVMQLLAESLHAAGQVLLHMTGPSAESSAFAEQWAAVTRQRPRVDKYLRTFKLEKVKPVTGVSGHLRRATMADRDLLVEWDLAFRREAFPENAANREEAERAVDFRLDSSISGIYLWDDGGAVCYSGYGGPTPHGIRIGPVYTPPEQRQQGYASACVAEMSQLLLDEGRDFCFLFTDLNNPTSNHIYQMIGYEGVCDFSEYSFG